MHKNKQMKKLKLDIIITLILSILVWVYFYLTSIPLKSYETIFIVGVIFALVYLIHFIIRKLKKK